MNNLKLFLEYIGLYLGMLVLAYLTITNKVPYQATLPAIMTIIVYIAGANVAASMHANTLARERLYGAKQQKSILTEEEWKKLG